MRHNTSLHRCLLCICLLGWSCLALPGAASAQGRRIVLYNELTAFNAQCPFLAYAYKVPMAADSVDLVPIDATAGRPLRLAYFTGRETVLYDRIKQGMLIQHSVIDTLDLTMLLSDKDKRVTSRSFTLRYPLLFKRCIIHSIKFPPEAVQTDPSAQTNGQDTSYDMIFSRKVFMIDTYLEGAFSPKGAFQDSLFLFNLVSGSVYFRRTTFNEVCIIGYRLPTDPTTTKRLCSVLSPNDTTRPCIRIGFDNGCAFRKTLYLRNPSPDAAVTLSWNYFGGPLLLGNLLSEKDGEPLVNRDFVNGKFLIQNIDNPGANDHDYFKRRKCFNLDFSYSTFRKKFSLRNSSASNINVFQCKFLDTLDLYNNPMTTFDSGSVESETGYQNAYLLKSNVILINIDNFNIDSLGLNNSSLTQANFVYPLDDARTDFVLTEDTLDRITDFYDQCIAWAQNTFQKDHPALASELAGRFAHDEILYRIKYYKTNSWPANFPPYVWYSLLEKVVGNGYHGEIRFVKTVFWVILLFSWAYFFFFQKEVFSILDPPPPANTLGPEQKPVKGLQFVAYAKCLWLSFVIFITPKYSSAYLQYRLAFIIVLSLEWVLGLVLIVLFLVYIAAAYPFIKSIVGL